MAGPNIYGTNGPRVGHGSGRLRNTGINRVSKGSSPFQQMPQRLTAGPLPPAVAPVPTAPPKYGLPPTPALPPMLPQFKPMNTMTPGLISALTNLAMPQSSMTPSPVFNGKSGNLVSGIMAVLRGGESSGNYNAQNPYASASGAYGYTNGTWNHYGGYARAADAPKSVQDAKARNDIMALLQAHGGDPRQVFAYWYSPAVAKTKNWNVIPMPQYGNKKTVAQVVAEREAALMALLGKS